nr:MAG TPA: hypothetical protein [Caudoviricetes sp.]
MRYVKRFIKFLTYFLTFYERRRCGHERFTYSHRV